MDIITIKGLIQEASQKYSKKQGELSQEQIDRIYNDWIGKEGECLFMEKDEVMERLRDMFEAD